MASLFAATGVAAALAASLTGLAVPIHAARADPPNKDVIVVNPATNPALARNVDDPGRIAYQSSLTGCVISSLINCTFFFPAVPQGHRLVVEHVSGIIAFTGDVPGALVFLEGGGPNEARSFFLAPPSLAKVSPFDQPVLQYTDAGSGPALTASSNKAGIDANGSSAALSGYLLDCATTPCAAIAH